MNRTRWILLIFLLFGCTHVPLEKKTTQLKVPSETASIEKQILCSPERIVISLSGEGEERLYRLFLPPRTLFSVNILDAQLKSTKGRTLNWQDIEGEEARIAQLKRQVVVKTQGYIRFNLIGEVRVKRQFTEPTTGDSFWIETLRFALEFDTPYWPETEVTDGAYELKTKGFARIVPELVANYEARELYADPDPPKQMAEGGYQWFKKIEAEHFIKLAAVTPGLYKIDYALLTSVGLKPETLRPRNFHCYWQGQEIPMLSAGGFEQSWTESDYLIVYTDDSSSPFTNKQVLWLTYEPARENTPPAGLTAKVTSLPYSSSSKPIANVFTLPLPTAEQFAWQRKVVGEDKELKIHAGHFLSIKGLRWVDEQLEPAVPLVREFSLPRLFPYSQPLKGILKLYWEQEAFVPNTQLRCIVNGFELPLIEFSSYTDETKELELPSGLLKETANTLQMILEVPEEKTQPVLLFFDELEIAYPQRFVASEGRLEFAQQPSSPTLRLYEITGLEGRVVGTRIFNQRESSYELFLVPSGEPLKVPTYEQGAPRYLFHELERIPQIEGAKLVRFNDLNEESADYVIISHAKFLPSTAALVELQEQRGMKTLLLDVEEVYDQFSFGYQEPLAIKRFLTTALSEWQRKPTFVLLVGDCTSDYKRLTRNDIVNYVPTYEVEEERGEKDKWASDHWYTTLLGEDELKDVMLGRISVTNEEHAREVVRKIVGYSREAPLGVWRQTFLYVADDGVFDEQCEELRQHYTSPTYLSKTVYLEEEPWEDNYYLPPEVVEAEKSKVSTLGTTKLLKYIDQGCVYLSFYGHGSPNIWCDERLWFGGGSENSDILNLRNYGRLPFVVNLTCNSGAIDYPVPKWNLAISEDFLVHDQGGAIALFVPSGPGFTSSHFKLESEIQKALFDRSLHRLGEFLTLASYNFLLQDGIRELVQMFILLGDPAMELKLPQAKCKLTIEPKFVLPQGPTEFTASVEGLPFETGNAIFMLSDPDNRLVNQTDSLPFTGGSLLHRFTLPDASPPQGAWTLRAYCWNQEQQKDAAGMASFFIEQPWVTITRFSTVGSDPASTDTLLMQLSLKNHAYRPLNDVKVVVWEGETRRPLRVLTESLGEKQEKSVLIEVELHPGLNIVGATLQNYAEPAEPTQELKREEVFAYGVPSGDTIDIAISSLFVTTEWSKRSREDILTINIPVFRIGKQDVREGNLRVEDGKGQLVQSRRLVMTGQETFLRKEQRLSIRTNELTDDMLVLNVEVPEQFNADRNNDEIRIPSPEKEIPDLVIESVEFSQEEPTEGVTVFMDVTIKNQGGWPAHDISVAAYDDDPSTGGKVLPDYTSYQAERRIEYLAPQGSTAVRLRWDPYQNQGWNTLYIKVDSRNRVDEAEEANNVVMKKLRAKSKAKLVPASMHIEQTPEERQKNRLRLVAEVRNDGETAARNVIVEFFRLAEQTEENRLGSTFVPLVEPGEMTTVEYEWNISAEDLKEKVRPTFRIFLKGSLQRVTSVDYLPEL